MKRNKTKKIGLLVTMMITTAFFAGITVQAEDSIINFSKTVWDPVSETWVKTIDVDADDVGDVCESTPEP